MRLRSLLFCGVLGLVGGLASVAAAPAVARADDAETAEAQARFKEGLDLADAGKHDQARVKFQQAWAVFKSASVLYNLARSEQLTGHDVEALAHFRQFLRFGPDPKITDAFRAKAQENVLSLSAKVAQIDIDVPPRTVLKIDGKALDDVPKDPVPVVAGRHLIEGALDGRTKTASVDSVVGVTAKVRLEFDAPSGAAAPPIEPPPVSPSSPSPARWLVPGTLGVLGLVGLGVGVGFALSSNSAADREAAARKPGACADPASATCQSLDSARSDETSAATLSVIGYVAGGALLAGAAITYLVWPKSQSSTTGLVLAPTRDGATAHLRLTF